MAAPAELAENEATWAPCRSKNGRAVPEQRFQVEAVEGELFRLVLATGAELYRTSRRF